MKTQVFRLGFDWNTYQFYASFRSPLFESMFWCLSETSRQRFGVGFFGKPFDLLYSEGKGRRSIYFMYGIDAVFCLTQILDSGFKKKVSYEFTFYGAYFYIEDLSHILLEFLEKYVAYIKVTRCDIALDTNIPVQRLWQLKHTQFKKKRRFEDGDEFTGFYLGKREGNHKHFIRVYNKKLDSETKQKFHLFRHYLEQEGIVTRIEVQIHSITIKNLSITPQAILDYERARMTHFVFTPNILEQWFASLCMDHENGGTNFLPLKGLSFKNVERLKTTAFTGRRKNVEEMERYEKYLQAQGFLTRSETMLRMGFDPILFLIMRLPPRDFDPYWEQVRTHRTISILLYQLPLSPYEVLPLCTEIE
jgi:hypothetical protein